MYRYFTIVGCSTRDAIVSPRCIDPRRSICNGRDAPTDPHPPEYLVLFLIVLVVARAFRDLISDVPLEHGGEREHPSLIPILQLRYDVGEMPIRGNNNVQRYELL